MVRANLSQMMLNALEQFVMIFVFQSGCVFILLRAKVLFVVAEWPLVRLAHWRLLLQARAVENQCYVVACNRAGKDPNNVFAGHSLLWILGSEVVEANEEESILFGELVFEKIREVRKGIPVLRIVVQNYTNKMLTSDFYSWYSHQHKVKNSKIIQLLSRAGGGIWPDEAQQPTVIPL